MKGAVQKRVQYISRIVGKKEYLISLKGLSDIDKNYEMKCAIQRKTIVWKNRRDGNKRYQIFLKRFMILIKRIKEAIKIHNIVFWKEKLNLSYFSDSHWLMRKY